MTSFVRRRPVHVARAALAVGALLAPVVLAAQDTPASGYRRAALLSVGAGTLPDAFTSRCGRQDIGDAGTGVGLAVLARARGWLVLRADAHVVAGAMQSGCILNLPTVTVAPGVYETRPGATFPRGTPGMPLVRTTVRVGAESPPGWPLLRATVGGGVFWAGRPAPVAVAAIGAGTRGRRARLYVEGEAALTRVEGTERRERFRSDASGRTVLGVTMVPLVFRPVTFALHAGVELPLAR